jgi:hypothetical protein
MGHAQASAACRRDAAHLRIAVSRPRRGESPYGLPPEVASFHAEHGEHG